MDYFDGETRTRVWVSDVLHTRYAVIKHGERYLFCTQITQNHLNSTKTFCSRKDLHVRRRAVQAGGPVRRGDGRLGGLLPVPTSLSRGSRSCGGYGP